MKDRSIDWIENKIIKVLSKQKYIETYLGLSSLVLENVNSTNEQNNLDKAIQNLCDKNILSKSVNDGISVYKLN